MDLTGIATPVTIPSGNTITVTGTATNPTAANLVIEDGGQLVNGTVVAATVKKNITAYTSANDGWNLISSPVNTELLAGGIGLTTATTYDLYYLDEENSKWINFKDHVGNTNPGFNIQPQKGYLYANAANTTLSFSGDLLPNSDAGCEISLTKVGEGWNLVGNPYSFNAYVNKSYYVINGRTVEVYTGSDPVPTCTGIIVKATGADNEKVTFRKTPFAVSAINNGNLQMTLAQTVATRGGENMETIDNAIVSFNEGSQLEKFYFGTQNANIYIPQGTEEYAIVSSSAQGEMPVNFRAHVDGTYTLTVETANCQLSTTNFNYLHLIDNIAGKDVDLIATPSYTFNARTDDFESRFRLVFSANSNENDNENQNFAFVSDGQLIVNGTGTLQIIDMTGRVISTKSTEERISTNGMTAGVYVLQLVNGTDVKTQKIIVK